MGVDGRQNKVRDTDVFLGCCRPQRGEKGARSRPAHLTEKNGDNGHKTGKRHKDKRQRGPRMSRKWPQKKIPNFGEPKAVRQERFGEPGKSPWAGRIGWRRRESAVVACYSWWIQWEKGRRKKSKKTKPEIKKMAVKS